MPRFHDRWTVPPHGPVDAIDDRILTVDGDIVMPLGRFPRRMTVVGLTRKRTAVFSAMALREPEMRRIEALGRPSFMIVPNAHHRLDARAWKRRYPKLQVICPAGARQAVSEAVPVDATDDILADPSVHFVTVAGTHAREGAMLVRRPGGTTLIINDIIANVRHPRGLGAQIMARLFGFGVKRPRVPRVTERILVRDRDAVARQLRDWAALPDLKRIIVSHGEPITEDPARVLERIAADIAA